MEVFGKPSDSMDKEQLSLKTGKRTISNCTNSSGDLDSDEVKLNIMDIHSKRQIHSKIEKRRRDKMNDYIAQLSTIIPINNSKAPKLDKITVLKIAAQYLKSIHKSPIQFGSKENLIHSFINDLELEKLVQKYIPEHFIFVVGCESARISYVSKSMSNALKCRPIDLVGCSLYDIIHPSDIDKVKKQISFVDLSLKQQTVDIKLPKNLNVHVPSEQLGVYPGTRRSFSFRINNQIGDTDKCSTNDTSYPFNNFNDANENDGFTIIQCDGYLKCWNPVNYKFKVPTTYDDGTMVTSFVAIGRKITVKSPNERGNDDKPITFISKHTTDGKFLFVEKGMTIVMGYLPQEMLGTNIYEYLHPDDVNNFAITHQSMVQLPSGTTITLNYRFRSKFGTYVMLQSEWKTFVNPWKNEVEFCYAMNTTIPHQENTKFATESQNDSSCLYKLDQYLPSADKQEQNNYQMDFCFQSINSGKFDYEDISIEAILNLF